MTEEDQVQVRIKEKEVEEEEEEVLLMKIVEVIQDLIHD